MRISESTKVSIAGLHGAFVAAILSSFGVWQGPWLVVLLQGVTVFFCWMDDRDRRVLR